MIGPSRTREWQRPIAGAAYPAMAMALAAAAAPQPVSRAEGRWSRAYTCPMSTTTLIRAEDFARIADVVGPSELVRGEVVRMSPGGVRHSEVVARVGYLLEACNRRQPSGRTLGGEAGLLVSRGPDTVRGADVAFISHARLPRRQSPSGFLTVPPELVVEVVGDDRSWAELEGKVAEYHAFGVDAVWVIDPRMEAVRVYPRGGEPFTRQGEAELTASRPAGFLCRVADLFE
jgi:Uma2 family endonuclease